MISWWWIIPAIFGGFAVGWVVLALMPTGREGRDYLTGYRHGYEQGAKDMQAKNAE